jgi:hypothetical protein
MSDSANPFARFTVESAIDLIMQVFQGQSEPTPADVAHRVSELLLAPPFAHLRPLTSDIVTEVLRRTRVVIGAATTLDNDLDHIEWFPQADRVVWRFWPRLEDYLRRVERLPPSVLHELDQSTDQTVERLEAPDRIGDWDRRGLVVGHVQSGKTTHYTAVAAKALDAGYQVVIILAGIHNSLRSQTHERIDRHLIGRHSAALVDAVRQQGGQGWTVGIFGVGEEDRRLGRPELPCALLTCTTSAEDGDFRTTIANQIGFQVGPGSRLVLVVKKNATILRNLISWLRLQNASSGTQAGAPSIPSPVLVIDDEADHASMNTARDPEADPTRINQLIRELLLSFNRVAFVGYTATPFANIFAFHEDGNSRFGPDLFPHSFIMNLKAPSDYVGPGLGFGHPGDESAGIPEQSPLPMYVPVLDSTPWIPDRHRRDCVPGPVPQSLRDAIRLFVLVCAARATRGQADVHNSMLVHATRFIDVQEKVERQVANEVDGLRNLIGLGSPSDMSWIEREFRSVWDQRIVLDHPAFRQPLADRCLPLPAWENVWGHVGAALRRIQPMRINGQSTDALAYSRKAQGLYVIAVGGDKLSRGLTLEGLSVSYFLRASSMFDTLMQMGRWFGYRAGYVDLCRVYTTPALYRAFREISLAMDDLRADLDYMAAVNKTPRDFGLRVRTPSDGLVITAANKIRRGEDVQVRFANTIVQALEIPRTGTQADQNRAAVQRLLERLGEPDHLVRGDETPHSLWRNIPVSTVLEFLGEYEALATPSFFNHCDALRRYVREQVSRSELTDWSIAVVGKKGENALRVGQHVFPLVFRTSKSTSVDRFETQAVVGSADEALDLDEAEFAKAMELSPALGQPGTKRRSQPARDAVRQARPAARGLLLLYLLEPSPQGSPEDFVPSVAISFPESETAHPLTYTVNKVWLEQRGLFAEWDDDASLS